jgi:hypothetical protein
MKYESNNQDIIIEEPSNVYSIIIISFGVGLVLSGELAQGFFVSSIGMALYFKYWRDYSKYLSLCNDLERKKIIAEIRSAKSVILLHEARKQEMESILNPKDLSNWILSQKNISDMWHKKIEILEKRLSEIP